MRTDKLILDLENLDDDDLQEVLELIHNKAHPQEVEQVARKKKRGRKQRRRKQQLDEFEEEDIIEQPRRARQNFSDSPRRTSGGRKKGNKRRRGRGQDFDIHEHRKRMGRGRRNKRVPAHTEGVDTHSERPNDFVRKGMHKLHKKDIAIDKALAGNNELTERRPEVQYIDVECTRCGNIWEVLPQQMYRDDTGQINFICDDCRPDRR